MLLITEVKVVVPMYSGSSSSHSSKLTVNKHSQFRPRPIKIFSFTWESEIAEFPRSLVICKRMWTFSWKNETCYTLSLGPWILSKEDPKKKFNLDWKNSLQNNAIHTLSFFKWTKTYEVLVSKGIPLNGQGKTRNGRNIMNVASVPKKKKACGFCPAPGLGMCTSFSL